MRIVDELIEAALEAADPRRAVASELAADGPVHVLAVGKAAPSMYQGAVDALGDQIASALVVGKHAATLDVEYLEADHPVPAESSLRAGRRVMAFVDELTSDDHLVFLLSGGASSLLTAPADGLTLSDLGQLTRDLMNAGASIEELNTVRREVDLLKGGGLAARCKASIATYVLSDVLGDPLEAIGSGPTAQNPTSRKDAVGVLRRYGMRAELPTIEPRAVPDVPHVVLANCATAVEAARARASELGLHAQVLTTQLRGEAREAGARLAAALLDYDGPRPACLIAGGETTVTVHGSGRGGPSLELALAAVRPLAGAPGLSLTTFATDGEDGPTDAAGANVDATTDERGIALGLDVAEALLRNNAYRYFEALDDLVLTGPTGTNVNDLAFGLVGIE